MSADDAIGKTRRGSSTSTGESEAGTAGLQQQMEQTAQQIKGMIRRASQVGTEDLPPGRPNAASASAPTQSEEDTMKNLRKTFAGIFGDV